MSALLDFKAGDRVCVDDDLEGIVAFNTCAHSWSADFPANAWPRSEYDGIMIRMDGVGLVFHDRDYFDLPGGRIRHVPRHPENS